MTDPAGDLHATPFDALSDWAQRRPEAEALAFPLSGGRRSFSQWHEEAEALARGLLDLGLAPGERIALLAENRVEWPVVQLGVAAMGGVLAPLNTHSSADELAHLLRHSGSRAILLSPQFRSNAYLEMLTSIRDRLPQLDVVVLLDGEAEDCLGYDALLARGRELAAALPVVDPEAPGSLQFSSGTTGRPKGALLSHRGMLLDSRGSAERLGLGPGDRWTSMIPLFHCAGCIMNLLGCLQAGACYVGVAGFDPAVLLGVIEAERCTHLSGVPTAYLAMLRHLQGATFDLGSLRAGTCGGADCNAEVLASCAEAFPIPGLCQVYGLTESCTLIACPEAEDPDRWETAGLPLPGLEVRITDPLDGTPLQAGAIGQIEARGPMIMIGYHEDPEATAAALDAEGWLKTGDLGRLSAEGKLAVAGGRLKDMIIRGGENIYPAEVEALLLGHPAVAEAAVFGLPDDYYGEVVAAALRLEGDCGAEDIRQHCAAHLARFKVPKLLYRVERYPLTSSGKIRKVELRAMAAAEDLELLP